VKPTDWRKNRTCQHLKRPEIDRRLAAGEPLTQVARDYDLKPSSLHRALEVAGIEFIEANGGDPAVRIQKRMPKL